MIDYSFVVPIFNDGQLGYDFCKEFERVLTNYLSTKDISSQVELIFVNDGSFNDSLEHLRKIATTHKFVKVIDLSRNFGQHNALSCGYKFATGKFVGMLNVDMQDPPDQIPLMLGRIKMGDIDLVLGLRSKRAGPMWESFSSKLFAWLLNRLTGTNTPLNVATLRIMSRRFVDAYNALTEKSRFIPGLESWLGFTKAFIDIRHQARQQGRSSYNFRRRARMAFESILSFSDIPLRTVALLGGAIAVFGLLLGILLICQKLFFLDMQPGYTSTVVIVVFLGGVQILVTGLASLYIGRILKEVQNRPLFIVKELINYERRSDS